MRRVQEGYEISKILRNEGLLVLSTPNPLGFPLIFIEWLGIKKYFYTKYHSLLYPPRWFERMLESNKLKVIKKYGFAWFPKIKVPIPLSYQMVFVCRKDISLSSAYQVTRSD